MNSIMQILFSMEEFKEKYGGNIDNIFLNETSDPTQSFNVQMAKLADGLLSGKYSTKESEESQESMVIEKHFFSV